ncbi:MAG: 16S rRNA (uracil(1498)-N(3))-methyltransferase [Candidatus Goldbacteria bacterium]|nr:16S rRNA (uracil(1498)-N(3))-methyltransferase [Candidatus Goldiibacteriota bacterium]HPD18319.1 RsmE family RNA methyltransferase [Candidatus Goldiibacteriota bacterium]
MHRFFVNKISDNRSIISGEDYSHIVTVLRLKQGDEISVFNYEHGEFLAEISSIDTKDKIIHLNVIKKIKDREKINVKVTAIISVIKNEKMDFIVEKLTELGVDEIIPVITKRSVVKINDGEKKIKRWEKIIYSAVKQCGRITRPEISSVVFSVPDLIKKTSENSMKFLIWEKEDKKYLIDEAENVKNADSVCFFTGPEGGFEQSETDELIKAGFIPVSLGDITLRAETAAILSAGVILQIVRRGKWKN